MVVMLIQYKSNANHCKINDICTEAPGGAGGPQKGPSHRTAQSDIFISRKLCFFIYLKTAMQNREIQGGPEDTPSDSQQTAGHRKKAYNMNANSL